MTLETEIRRLNDTLIWLGINPENGKLNYRVLLYAFSIITLMVNNMFFLIYKWDDFDSRVIGIKSITNCILLGSHTLNVILNWDDVIVSLRTIEGDHYRVPYERTLCRSQMEEGNRRKMARLAMVWYYAVFINAAIGCIVPIISFANALRSERIHDIKPNQLILMIPFYFPKNYETVFMFFVAYIIQNTFHVFGTKYGYYGVVTSFLCLQTMVGELKHMKFSIEEADTTILDSRVIPKNEIENELDYNSIYLNDKDTITLKSFLRYFIKHHQEFHRRMAKSNRSVQWFAVISNFGVSVYICLGLFYIAKGSDFSEKVQEFFICSLWLYSIYCYDYYGETITTEDDHLRTALYGCLWTERPQWFKKSILIVLTRMTKSEEVKPIGLFVLNLKNFALCINAAYSYYNLLTKLD